MSQIVFSRIDNRLVHGQVASLWSKSVSANLLVVVDDAVAADSVQQGIMKMTADTMGIDIRFFSVQKTIDIIAKAASHQKIFVVAKTPEEFMRLAVGGVEFDKLNIGNMHYSEGKEQISTKVFVDNKDLENFEIILDYGVDLFIQDTPDEHKKEVNKENLWKLI